MRPDSKQSGFTLLEILVAFTLMAMIFGTIMQIISGSAKNAVKASNNTRIAMLAQSKMDELGLFEKLEEGTNSGDFDDNNSWELIIEPYDVPYEGNISQEFSTVQLMDVTLTISSRQGNQEKVTEFKTLRAVTPDYTRPR
jgi:general secretion pathway protein I